MIDSGPLYELLGALKRELNDIKKGESMYAGAVSQHTLGRAAEKAEVIARLEKILSPKPAEAGKES